LDTLADPAIFPMAARRQDRPPFAAAILATTMAKKKSPSKRGGATGANVGYEAQLWQMARGEGETRKSLIEADLVDCMVALPGQLFYSTQIPACPLRESGRLQRNGPDKGGAWEVIE